MGGGGGGAVATIFDLVPRRRISHAPWAVAQTVQRRVSDACSDDGLYAFCAEGLDVTWLASSVVNFFSVAGFAQTDCSVRRHAYVSGDRYF